MATAISPITRFILSSVSAGFLVCGPVPAAAATITITGGFTSYQGPAGCGQFGTIINNMDLTPSSGCDPVSFTAPIFVDLGSGVESVEFHGTQFGQILTPNALTFVAAPPQTIDSLGDEILLGVLQYTNGTWFGVGPVATFGFQLTTSSVDPDFDGHMLSSFFIMEITSSTAGNTPQENADFLHLAGFPDLGSLRVYEAFDSPSGSNTGWVALYGTISSIDPTRFADVQGGGFLDPGIATQPTTVPEPATMLLMASGIIAMLRRKHRR